MSFETKRGFKVTKVGKEVIIACPTDQQAKEVFDKLYLQVLRSALKDWGLPRRVRGIRN